MNWKLIFSLLPFGFVMGVASVFGLTQGIEWLLWLIIAVVCAFVVSRRLQTKHFPTALLVGFSMSLLNGVIQSAFFNTYLSNNTMAAQGFKQIPGGLDPRFFILVSSLVIGIVYGAVIGLFTLLVRKFSKGVANQSPTT
ncbi:hypothetical protein [Stygiobacter electus]|uniref:Uncharacterized protein n=1 Tax=Stygiobacter electus TaxID=3032292 RepID=A0AAE3TFC8_9BACT|nr:hypothetical protein [Stygiobacter electus]MDF1613308.1 hypothetical protein [Stygiobacter electus]